MTTQINRDLRPPGPPQLTEIYDLDIFVDWMILCLNVFLMFCSFKYILQGQSSKGWKSSESRRGIKGDRGGASRRRIKRDRGGAQSKGMKLRVNWDTGYGIISRIICGLRERGVRRDIGKRMMRERGVTEVIKSNRIVSLRNRGGALRERDVRRGSARRRRFRAKLGSGATGSEKRKFEGRSWREEESEIDIGVGLSSSISLIIMFSTFFSYHWWLHTGRLRTWDYFQIGDKVIKEMDHMDAYNIALSTWGKWVDSNIDSTKTQVSSRGFLQYITKARDGMNLWRIIFFSKRNPLGLKKDGHPSRYADGGIDCSHWCVAAVPDSWNEILYTILVDM
ncbi:hypothetical protein POM88_052294 [Heracleum sosnowskyi]|uniref:Trichome birefringence-like C-terminal domain-containing protein n=1 Tax=Heracleum sosnowskyi TaxID=360622 RepID=A0AAD8LZD0_9APIA|nr:hypothetical protein POM88_052294 [Heracleum sosnowskyi]